MMIKEEDGTKNVNVNVPKKTNRKRPIIRQTLTSLFRIAKANPLLLLDKNDANEHVVDSLGLRNIQVTMAPPNLTNKSLISISALKQSLSQNKTGEEIRGNFLRNGPVSSSVRTAKEQQQKSVDIKRSVSVRAAANPKPKEVGEKPFLKPKVPSANTKAPNANLNGKTKKKNVPIRRSLSAQHFDKKRQLQKTKTEQVVLKKEITQSMENVDLADAKPTPAQQNGDSFKTPRTAHVSRRQTISSPTNFQRNSVPFTSTPGPETQDLQQRLGEWLKKHNKPHGSYHHLKCFGLAVQKTLSNEGENKENVNLERTKDIVRGSSYESLHIQSENNIDGGHNLQPMVRDALSDLNALILEGYQQEQCEAWLGQIREKYRFIEEEPQYWECRAAIEQSRGNISSAVECLRAAIIQGAEVQAVDQSLEKLLKKFSLLHLSPSYAQPKMKSGDGNDRERIMRDARNAFKSSIIRFAVQERSLMKKPTKGESTIEEKYLITPVRRSTRISRSAYNKTPGMEIRESLEEFHNSTGTKSFKFQNNKYLSIKYQ